MSKENKGVELPKEDLVDAAMEAIAEGQDELKKEVATLKKQVGSIKVVAQVAPKSVELPIVAIDGVDYRVKFAAFVVKNERITAASLVEDEAKRLALFAQYPSLFIQV